MEVRIGVLHCPKELEVEASVNDALKDGKSVLWLTDVRGRKVGVPAERVAYVEIEHDADAKRVGFGPG